MDVIFIDKLKTESVIGVFDFEKERPQLLVFDIQLATDIRPAAASDDLCNAVDYAAVSELVKIMAKENKAELVETLVENIAAAILAQFAVQGIKIRLHKPQAVPEANSVGVYIERGKPF